MLIISPLIVDKYIKNIPIGHHKELQEVRKDLAEEYKADKTCPVSTGIFLRIVAEAAYEKYSLGTPIEAITPFWRVISPSSKIAQKLACGITFIQKQREKENIID